MAKKGINIITKIILSIVAGLVVGWLLIWVYQYNASKNKLALGVTYSTIYAAELGLNPRQTYTRVLDELGVKKVRFPVYWSEVERQRGVFDFSDTAWYLDEADKRGVEVIVQIGYKQPRWPECFAPSWSKDLSINEFTDRVLEYEKATIEALKVSSAISMWQLENEFFLPFGVCGKTDETRLDKEIALAKQLDNRAILLTESGELNDWVSSYRLADVLGISVYRTVWNPFIGLVDYPLPPVFYGLKNYLSAVWAGKRADNTIITELQTEGWGTKSRALRDIPIDELVVLFAPEDISKNVDYARATGLKVVYLWGVEWWYFMGKHGASGYIEEAKKVFR